ncbi:putative F-box domain, leucine-rich repeat domain, L domain-containing protein [Medicago truncatula]|uniref:Putative F-box domain, leucine-rich repeat domain, L domain-containing protein n=1 Tax=Medicago truncatula TaxID=3880 RepID=A0A396GWD3_MEDTR|nr:F-box protein At2g39490 [Medicago truncatula]RHN44748.1 putative F-box domain, leucine-rich repeat domain, L domain-containing protein [Medicago truncatula]
MEKENTSKDLFSNLPKEIIGRIVSFLPNESSMETILISTRWRDLWNETIVRYGTKEEITSVVTKFLTSFDDLDPLKHPRKLQFHYEDKVLLATIANNSKLLLDFSPLKKEFIENIQMHFELHFKLNNQQKISYKSFTCNIFSLKSLYLKSISYLTSEVASSIISSLDHLENLVIISCNGLQSLSIDSNFELHKLTILDCLQLKYLHLKTSKLKSFQFRGPLPWILPEFHFNLSDAMLDFRLGPSCGNFKTKDFDATLLTIKNSQVLTLCRWTFEELIWPSICPPYGCFNFYNLRELWWIDNYKDEYCMDALFSFLKLCPSLEQLFVTIDAKSYSTGRSVSWFMQATKCTKLEHVNLIKFMGFTSRKDEISLAKCLIHLIKGKLPKINISDGSCLDEFLK